MNRYWFPLMLSLIVVCPSLCAGLDFFAEDLPDNIHVSKDGARLIQGGAASTGFYDETVIRTINLEFSQENWWQQLDGNYVTEVNIPATLIMDGVTYDSVGVRFKGMTSYSMTKNSQKKSFNISIDFTDSGQKLMGYKTLNLNNCFNDPSFTREVLYFNICRNYIPCPRANYVKLVINGENWGIYTNAQQLNSDFIDEWFLSSDGDRFKVAMNMGINRKIAAVQEIPGGQIPPDSLRTDGQIPPDSLRTDGQQIPGGQRNTDRQQPGGGGAFGGGNGALTWLGNDPAAYEQAYELKSSHSSDPYGNLMTVCNILNNIPLAQLADTLDTVLDIDRCLWFLAMENLFTDEDSYLNKGADYQLYYEAETGRIHPLQFDGNECMKLRSVNMSPFEGEALQTRPLISRLLAVPELRQRYLAHIRTVLDESFDWSILGPQVNTYRELIEEEVFADRKKLCSDDEFISSFGELETLFTSRRTFLLNLAVFNRQSPQIVSVEHKKITETGERNLQEGVMPVTAQIAGSVSAQEVYLYHASGLVGAFTRAAMYDDGAHGDGAAGDGTWGGVIPAYPGTGIVRYYIEARAYDDVGTCVFSPAGAEHDVYFYTQTVGVAEKPPVIINELMASNQTTVQDPQGDYDDWIELKNISDHVVDLSGMYLSDSADNLLEWSFPTGTTIAPGSYYLVWADDDEDDNGDGSGLHANFKISAGGETIFLVDTDERGNQILDSVEFGELDEDVSWGRFPDGAGDFTVLQEPTPAQPNRANTEVNNVTPLSFELKQNYPNPFNSSTVIAFTLPREADIELTVYDLLGRKVTTLIDGNRPAGICQVLWDGRDENGNDMASGVYIYRLRAGTLTKSGRLLLLR